MRRLAAAIAACAMNASASAQTDTQITILGVLVDASADYNVARQYLQDLADPWYWTSPVNATGASVRLANFGLPVPMPAPKMSDGVGTAPAQLQDAINDQLGHDFRRDADVIIYFTADFSDGACGLARQTNWTDEPPNPVGAKWQPDANGLDLNGANHSFEAIVATTGFCANISVSAIHELGHLFGAGHQANASYLGYYLFTSSHARTWIEVYPDRRRQLHRTILGSPIPTDPVLAYPPTWVREWSRGQTTNANNRDTIATTWRSVANYRITTEPPPPPPPNPPPPPLPPGCTLQPPVQLQSTLIHTCVPGSIETQFRLYWGDVCPGATSYYYLEKIQPPSTPNWQFFANKSVPWTDVFIVGAPGSLRIFSCNASTCVGPSPEQLFIPLC